MDGEDRHAEKVMRELGITYQSSVPQSIADQWWFFNCQNIPENLPSFLERADFEPMRLIGHGLSQQDAEAIRDYKFPTK